MAHELQASRVAPQLIEGWAALEVEKPEDVFVEGLGEPLKCRLGVLGGSGCLRVQERV